MIIERRIPVSLKQASVLLHNKIFRDDPRNRFVKNVLAHSESGTNNCYTLTRESLVTPPIPTTIRFFLGLPETIPANHQIKFIVDASSGKDPKLQAYSTETSAAMDFKYFRLAEKQVLVEKQSASESKSCEYDLLVRLEYDVTLFLPDWLIRALMKLYLNSRFEIIHDDLKSDNKHCEYSDLNKVVDKINNVFTK